MTATEPENGRHVDSMTTGTPPSVDVSHHHEPSDKNGKSKNGNDKAPHKFAGMFSPLVLDISSVGASVALGLVTAANIIDERAYKNLTSLYLVEDIKDQRRLEGPRIWKEHAARGNSKVAYADVQGAVHKYSRLMDERFAALGIKSVGDKLGLLRTHQKWEVAITALSAFAISIGTLFVVTRTLLSEQEKQQEKLEKQERQDALDLAQSSARPAGFVEAQQQRLANASAPSLAV